MRSKNFEINFLIFFRNEIIKNEQILILTSLFSKEYNKILSYVFQTEVWKYNLSHFKI